MDGWMRLLDEFIVFVRMILMMSIAISFIILLSINTMDILERKYELAILKAVGYTRREIMGALLLESLLVATPSIGLGIILGHVVSEILLRIFTTATTEEFILLSTTIYSWKAIGIALTFIPTIILAKLLSIRYVLRLNIAEVLKEEPS